MCLFKTCFSSLHILKKWDVPVFYPSKHWPNLGDALHHPWQSWLWYLTDEAWSTIVEQEAWLQTCLVLNTGMKLMSLGSAILSFLGINVHMSRNQPSTFLVVVRRPDLRERSTEEAKITCILFKWTILSLTNSNSLLKQTSKLIALFYRNYTWFSLLWDVLISLLQARTI